MPFKSSSILILLAFTSLQNLKSSCRAGDAEASGSSVFFESSIRPILTAKCGKCHSKNVQKGELDLSSITSIRRGGESGESAISATVEESLLWIMIDGGGMPPEDEPQLTGDEKDLISKWIAGGALSSEQRTSADKELHQHHVLPILLLRCAACHGAQRRDGGLDLRSVAGIREGGKSGPCFVPGNPEQSLMIQRIEKELCPPSELLLKFFVKRPPESEVDILRDWIAAGASVADITPDVATSAPDTLVTDEDRQHWAYQSLTVDSAKSSVDEFIEGSLSEVGLEISDSADRETLIRRVYFDLTGLPPTLDEFRHWRESEDPNWYSEMIDKLLDSPRYGERWGRFWLDLAGYADSEGGVSADPIREFAWKYRDYVIRSFNSDKPYDRFLLEQIAGDELIDFQNASVITQEIVDNLIATGFLRMGIDQTGSRTMNFVPERLGVIDDAINVLGSSVMGLTLECARCHSHKYDAIPHRDYYRLKAIFQGALDEHDWLSFKTRKLNVGTEQHRKQVAATNPVLNKQLKSLESQLKETIKQRQLALLHAHYPDQSEADRDETIRALKIADNNRTLPQRILVEKLQRVELIPEASQPDSVQVVSKQISKLEDQIQHIRRQMVPEITIRALWDRGQPSPTYILHRGEHNKPGRLVGPGVPSVLTDGQTPFVVTPPFSNARPSTGRRLAFARWLIDLQHPLTTRVMVNRIWYHHFGRGIVETLENFGVNGAEPSHSELLDWLAAKFIENDWSIKEMHRLIMNSRTYRQQSHINSKQRQKDPENVLLSRMTMRRLDAESLRDSILFVAGKLDETPYGRPDPVSMDLDGQVRVDATPEGRWRRSLYMQYRRTEIPSMMQTFDYPEMGPNCVARNTSIVSPQSLMLMNNDRIRELAKSFANRVLEIEPSGGIADRVSVVYQLALSRDPTPVELALGINTLNHLNETWPNDPTDPLAVYCHTILNSAAFTYID